MTSPDQLDAEISTLMRATFDRVGVDPPAFVAPTPKRRTPGLVAVVSIAVLVLGVPAAAVSVHRALVDQAFTDMGVPGSNGAPAASHLILESSVPSGATVRLYRADAPARTQSGKSGDCVFAETVVDGKVAGGKGFCFTPSGAEPPVLSASQFAIVQLPDGDTPANVTARRATGYEFTTTSKAGYAVLAPLPAGPLELTYEVAGKTNRVVVDVP
jgi:hypothetical protein